MRRRLQLLGRGAVVAALSNAQLCAPPPHRLLVPGLPAGHPPASRSFSVNAKPAVQIKTATRQDPAAQLRNVRNIGIIAHIDAGKTTTTERILYYAGAQSTIGEVDRGTTTTDFLEEETQRGITITSAAVRLNWNDHQINLIDTPGHVDFAIEVERSLRVLDGVVAIFDAAVGVQAQSFTVLKMAKRSRTPAIAFINKMDKPTANFQKAVKSIATKLKVEPLLVQLPLLADDGAFIGVCDVIEQVTLQNDGDRGETVTRTAIEELPDHLRDQLREARHVLIEKLAAVDDEVATALIEALDKSDGDELAAEQDLSADLLHRSVRRCVLQGLQGFDASGGAHNGGQLPLLPILCGASRRNIGVQSVMNAVIKYLPSPLDRPPLEGFTEAGDLVPAPKALAPVNVALAFKVMFFPDPATHAFRPLVWMRVYSGSFKKGQRLANRRTKEQFACEKLYVMQGDKLREVESMNPGDIGAMFVDKAATGDTIIGERSKLNHRRESHADDPISEFHTFEPINPPQPVLSHCVESRSKQDIAALKKALANLSLEDPTFMHRENEHGQLVVTAMGELHVEVMMSRLRRQFHMDCSLTKATIEYAESVVVNTEPVDVVLACPDGRPLAKVQIVLRPLHKDDELIPGSAVVDSEQLPAGVITTDAEEAFRESMDALDKMRKDEIRQRSENSDDDERHVAPTVQRQGQHIADVKKRAKVELRAMRAGLAEAVVTVSNMGTLKLKMLGVEFAVTNAVKVGTHMGEPAEYGKAFTHALAAVMLKNTTPAILEPMMDVTITTSEEKYRQDVFHLLNDRLASHTTIEEDQADSGLVIKAVVPMRTITKFSTDLRKATKGNAHYWTTLRCYKPVTVPDLHDRIVKSLGHS